MTRAIVFGYHQVGVRCLKVLLAHGVDVPLVVTHEDAPGETIWFDSVAITAAERGIATRTPEDPNTPEFLAEVTALKPDFVFSFYYRKLLKEPLLDLAPCGALNLHGSLLPKYRGRVPVNWAVLHGERETGVTLHYMTIKPDAGDIVAQMAVPILPDDTAPEVFAKVTVAAEIVLDRALPGLLQGTAPRTRQSLAEGSYFGGRRPEDGNIDWSRNAAAIHNLVRAVAPPYPGAFCTVGGAPARVLRTRILDLASGATLTPTIAVRDGRLTAECGGGGTLHVLALEVDGTPMTADGLVARFGPAPVLLGVAAR